MVCNLSTLHWLFVTPLRHPSPNSCFPSLIHSVFVWCFTGPGCMNCLDSLLVCIYHEEVERQ